MRVLGPPAVARLADGAVVATSPRQVALLAYLAVADPDAAVSRDSVAALLWPDADEARARRSLRNALHELRRACGGPLVVTLGKHQLRLDRARVRCDIDDLLARLSAGDARGALERYAELLEGFHVRGADGFERWHEATRAALRERVLTVARRQAIDRADGTPADAVALLQAARRVDPDDERLLRALMDALALTGDLPAARRAYRAHAERLAHEDEGVPTPETVALAARLEAEEAARVRTTIALVPLTTAPGDARAAELARALDDGVRRRLTRRPDVRVIARAALPPAAAQAPLEAWRALRADCVVTGTLEASESELVIALEVMRPDDGTLVRALRHRAPARELFALEGVVAAAVVPPAANGASTSPLPPPQSPRDAETHLLCLRGHWHFFRAAHVGASREDIERGRECYEAALARDPAYGAAYAGLSNYFAVCAARGYREPFEEAFGQTIALSHRALELDPSLAVPHVHFGVRALYLERDWPTAEREFAEAVRLDPGYAEAHRFLGIVRRALGDHARGTESLREAVRLEPQAPLFHNSLADALLHDGDAAAAVTELEIALALDPGYRAAAERLVRSHEREGRHDDAVAARRRLAPSGDAETFAAALASEGADGYRRARIAELEAQVRTLRARLEAAAYATPAERFAPSQLPLALALAELGRWDEAWAVEEAVPEGIRPWFTGHPWLAPLAPRRAARKAPSGRFSL